jgi:hypothetical protein
VERLEAVFSSVRQPAARIPAPTPWVAVGLLLVAQWVVDYRAAMIASHNGWQFYNGGDGSWYFTTDTILAHGHIPQATLGYGYSLLLAPILHFYGPNAMLGLPAIVLFNQLVLVPIALLCVYGIANMIGGRWFAAAAGVVWVAFPVAVIHYFHADYHMRYVDMQMPPMVGVTPEGDYPSMVLLLVSAYFVLRFTRSGRMLDVVTSGLAAGFAVVVKPSNFLFVPAPLVALLIGRNPRAIAAFAGAFLPSVLGLTIWKARGLGYVPFFQHQPTAVALGPHPRELIGDPMTSWWHGFVPLSWPALHRNFEQLGGYTVSRGLIIALVIAGFIGLAKRWMTAAAFMGTWLGMYVLVKGSSTAFGIADGDLFNHLIPAFPAFFFTVLSFVFLVSFLKPRLRAVDPASEPMRDWRLRYGPAGVLAVITTIGLAVVATFPPLTSADEAVVTGVNFIVPANAFGLTAKRVDRSRVRLHWDPQRATDGTFSYGIFRDPADRLSCAPIPGATSRCVFTGVQIAAVPGSRHSWTDPHAGRKAWTYYVAFSSTPGQPQYASDYLMLSDAASVEARLVAEASPDRRGRKVGSQ